MAEHDTEDVGLPTSAFRCDHRRASAEVDLSFLARRALQTPEGQRGASIQPPTETLDTVVADRSIVFCGEILMNANAGQALGELLKDQPAVRFAVTGPAR